MGPNNAHSAPYVLPSPGGSRGVAWADDDRDRIQSVTGPRWEIWYVSARPRDISLATWHARPTGSPTAACHAQTADGLLVQITEYMLQLPVHIDATSRSLLECEPAMTGHVERLTARLDAQRRLRDMPRDERDAMMRRLRGNQGR